MTDPDEIGQALAVIARAFALLAVKWAIGGSVASAAHGEPRATNDVDVIALLSEKDARAFTQHLGTSFYADADVAAEAARRHSCFNVIDNRSFIKIDVFVPPPGPLGAGQLDRLQMLPIFPGIDDLPILGPEDVILQKLRLDQLGGAVSDRQWRDVVSVLRIARDAIDMEYVLEVATRHGLGDVLARAREDANAT